ncbi:hypothetical protein GCM10008170_38030 [Methylopila capsulata]|uniref:Uncharacterized protein n=1 Tax=Methylopila capsulata TaxID=61654 RepID=A0A9W6IWG9_9HYPH|nr:hypothetical protein GCM10008170_38030 [Methylopila capsulata]
MRRKREAENDTDEREEPGDTRTPLVPAPSRDPDARRSPDSRGDWRVFFETPRGSGSRLKAGTRPEARRDAEQPPQNRKYRCAMGRTSAGSHVRSSPSARTS